MQTENGHLKFVHSKCGMQLEFFNNIKRYNNILNFYISSTMYIIYNNLKAQIQTVIFIAQAHMWLKISMRIEFTTLLLFRYVVLEQWRPTDEVGLGN